MVKHSEKKNHKETYRDHMEVRDQKEDKKDQEVIVQDIEVNYDRNRDKSSSNDPVQVLHPKDLTGKPSSMQHAIRQAIST